MKIANREIGPGHPTFVCAEISCNHDGKFENACKLILAASKAGADAVKLQCFYPHEMVPEKALCPNRDPYTMTEGPWAGMDLWDLYTKAMTPHSWFAELFDYARELGMIPFASVFSQDGIDFLESLDCPAYKIASPEIGDLGLIRAVATTGKPLIISTGAATEEEVDDAVEAVLGDCSGLDAIAAALNAGEEESKKERDQRGQFALLHCISAYPVPDGSMALGNIRQMRQTWWYGVPIGLSDHSRDEVAAVTAVGLGADIIEKHLKLPNVNTFDADFSLYPQRFKFMVDNIRRAESMVGHLGVEEVDQTSQQWKRRLIFARAVAQHTTLTRGDIRTGRSSVGLPPSADIIGRETTRHVEAGEPVTEETLK